MRITSNTSLMIPLIALLLFSGCQHQPGSGKERGAVTVTVTAEGKPITGVTVNLQSDTTGEGGSGLLDEQGIAKLKNVPTGQYKVTVSSMPPDDPSLMSPDGVMPEIKPNLNVPKAYQSVTTSPLKLEVKAEPTEYTFELEKTEE